MALLLHHAKVLKFLGRKIVKKLTKKIPKFLKKSVDKPGNPCYTIITKGKEKEIKQCTLFIITETILQILLRLMTFVLLAL
jgi:hypothetical protein